MIKALLLTLLMVQVTCAFAASETKKTVTEQKSDARAIMDGVYDSFIKVIPYVYSDERPGKILFRDSGQKAELLKNLTDIADYFKSARHVEYFQRPGFRPSLETINYHLEDTIRSVKTDNVPFAIKRMKALTALCISCHSQLSENASQNAFGTAINKAQRENFDSDFAYANYLFLVRRFSDSEKYFDLAIEKGLKDGVKDEHEHEVYSSLRKGISIHTKIDFNVKAANSFIDRHISDSRLPPLAKNSLLGWQKSLKKWSNFNPKKIKSIEGFIKTYLGPLENDKGETASGDNDITLLVAGGVLSKYLNDHPKTKLAPEILYWLSIAERRLSSTYFFSLSDLYLKDCIKLYPKSRFARKCYNEYAENIEFGYSGSSGTDIPVEEKQELERLKKILK